nr:PREDICTED: geraniol 8-hydroxylase-like [Daucus carota subsp. sativus]
MELFQSYLYLSMILLLILGYCTSIFRRKNLPPGPRGLSILGNLLEIGPNPHQSLAKLAQKYGPLMTIHQGSVTTIVASSADTARLVLQKHDADISGRIIPDAISTLEHPSHAVAWLHTGDEWRMIRRVLTTFLTNSHKLDSLCELRHGVMDQMVRHVEKISKSEGEQGVEIAKLAFTTALNQMSNTCFSTNVDEYDHQDSKGFKNAVATIMDVAMKFNVADYFPLLKAFDLQKLRPMANAAYGCLEELCDDYIHQRLQHRENKLPKHGDLLDSLIDFSQENQSDFTLKHIQVLLVELFLGGTDTSTNTTEWAMTELILHPDKMTKLRNEISESVRLKGRIQESELLKLPYLQAIVKETMRLHLAVPFLFPHKTETNVNLNSYEIPKNTPVLVNAWAIARDPTSWEDTTSFKPERFLDSEVDFKGQHFSFLPFGSGRRICPGIPLAHRVVSLMIASLVYHFEWKLPHGMKPQELDMNQTYGLTLVRAVPLVTVPVPVTQVTSYN